MLLLSCPGESQQEWIMILFPMFSPGAGECNLRSTERKTVSHFEYLPKRGTKFLWGECTTLASFLDLTLNFQKINPLIECKELVIIIHSYQFFNKSKILRKKAISWVDLKMKEKTRIGHQVDKKNRGGKDHVWMDEWMKGWKERRKVRRKDERNGRRMEERKEGRSNTWWKVKIEM